MVTGHSLVNYQRAKRDQMPTLLGSSQACWPVRTAVLSALRCLPSALWPQMRKQAPGDQGTRPGPFPSWCLSSSWGKWARRGGVLLLAVPWVLG